MSAVGRALTVAVATAAFLLLSAAPARAGYDIAHTLRITCAPGAPLELNVEWQGYAEADVFDGPGAVVGCATETAKGEFQIAAGRERAFGKTTNCSFFSHSSGAGMDICRHRGLRGNGLKPTDPYVEPLLVVRTDPEAPALLVGTAHSFVEGVSLKLPGRELAEAEMITVIPEQMPNLDRPFSYFAVRVGARRLCRSRDLSVVAWDRDGARLDEEVIERPIITIDTTARVGPVRPISEVCKRIGRDDLAEALEGGLVVSWMRDVGLSLAGLFAQPDASPTA